MASRSALAALGLRRALGTVRGSCGGAEPPPCAPCTPAPRPPCRAQPPTRARATRRVCCPPPQGDPPPCAPPPCPPVLNCSHVSEAKKRLAPLASAPCGGDRDGVALRLALAARARQHDYEQEVRATRRGPQPPPPPEPYTLGAERECRRATDGRRYALPCDPAPPPRCGPGRTPPPDRCVELLRDNECTIRDGDHVDPCAHAPRTLVDVDRAAAAPQGGFTSRIMKGLNLTRASAGSCSRSTCDPKCETTGAKRAGDTGWCRTQPKPPVVPPPCREPTPMEKLKPRGPGKCSKTDETGKRGFHTSASNHSCAPPKRKDQKQVPAVKDAPATASRLAEETATLKKALEEREGLLEAGRGRVVTGGGVGPASAAAAVGTLDIPVPTGADSVRVRVSLDRGRARRDPCCPPARESVVQCSGKTTEVAEKQEPWLSIKTLQKKFTSCRKVDTTKTPSKDPATCPRPQPLNPKPSAPPSPCAPPERKAPPSPCAPPKRPTSPTPCAPPKRPTSPSPCASPKPQKAFSPSNKNCPPCQPPKQVKRFSIPPDYDQMFIKW